MLKIGHRGAKGHAPENTLISFQKAIDLGAHGIELDVHLSSDGELMVIHDQTVNRTTSGEGSVIDLSAKELKLLRIDQQHKIPTLEEVLTLIDRKIFINIELKGPGTAKPATLMITKYIAENQWSYDHFIVSSFDWNALLEVRALNPEINLGVLTQTDLDLTFGFAQFLKAKSIHPYYHLLTKEKTRLMQEKGLQVFPWTVNEPEDLSLIKSFDVDGIISDFPDRI